MEQEKLIQIIEAALMAYEKPLSIDKIIALFDEDDQPDAKVIADLLDNVMPARYEGFTFRLRRLASGYTFQVEQDYAHWLARLWEDKPQRYSRAFLETLVIIAYRQPVTRAEIESIRGVAVNTHIIKTLLEREWIKVIGHREVPGHPAILGTTKQFLDYFNLQSLNDLPSLDEIHDLELAAKKLSQQLELDVSPDLLGEDEKNESELALSTYDDGEEPDALLRHQVNETVAQGADNIDDVMADIMQSSMETGSQLDEDDHEYADQHLHNQHDKTDALLEDVDDQVDELSMHNAIFSDDDDDDVDDDSHSEIHTSNDEELTYE